MIKLKNVFVFILILFCGTAVAAQAQNDDNEQRQLVNIASPEDFQSKSRNIQKSTFDHASDSIKTQLEDSILELNQLREQVAGEIVPLSKKLSDLEAELVKVRLEYQQTTRLLDSRTLDLSNLRSEIKSRREESTYLSNLLGEYIRNFESRLHIAELQRYRDSLEEAKLALENSNLSEQEIYEAQAKLLSVSLDRLNDALGGTRFEGKAVDSSGLVKPGTFVMIGPAAIFQSKDGQNVGTVEQRLGSLEPSVLPFGNILDAEAASKTISGSGSMFPLDPTLGNAHKIEETKESFLEHIQKGGVVMYPIFALAGAALLVALYKWVFLAFIKKPSRKQIDGLLVAVAEHDETAAKKKAVKIGGPVGRMLLTGIEHIKEPVELIEEVMYEKVLDTKLKLNRMLPFIAISAASAPLLGLLGTVTGIINTFKLITVFGSGDVKTLSGGISEALITTEFGLIVAIPSLLLHAFLSRKARSVVDDMEKAALALVNQINKTPYRKKETTDLLSQLTAGQVQDFFRNLNNRSKMTSLESIKYSKDSAGGIMNPRVISVGKDDTVGQAIDKIRSSEANEGIDTIFIVNEQGKYEGHIPVHHLLTRPEQTQVESLADKKTMFVRVDAHESEVENLLKKHNIMSMPVLDHEDRLVGWIPRNGGNGNGDRS